MLHYTDELSQKSEPVVAICAPGPARVGKSTMMASSPYLVQWLAKSIAGIEAHDIATTKLIDQMPCPATWSCPVSGKPIHLASDATSGRDGHARPGSSAVDAYCIRIPAGAFGRTTPLVIVILECQGTGDKDKDEHEEDGG